MELFFKKKSEMTAYAKASGFEMIRCKQICKHVNVGRNAILLVGKSNIIIYRLIRCKVCANKYGGLDNG